MMPSIGITSRISAIVSHKTKVWFVTVKSPQESVSVTT